MKQHTDPVYGTARMRRAVDALFIVPITAPMIAAHWKLPQSDAWAATLFGSIVLTIFLGTIVLQEREIARHHKSKLRP